MMKQPPVDPGRGQAQQTTGSQGGQPQHQRLHSLKNMLTNQQQVQPEQLSQMSQMQPQFAGDNPTVMNHQIGDNSGTIILNKQNNQARQPQP